MESNALAKQGGVGWSEGCLTYLKHDSESMAPLRPKMVRHAVRLKRVEPFKVEKALVVLLARRVALKVGLQQRNKEQPKEASVSKSFRPFFHHLVASSGTFLVFCTS